MAQTKKIKFLIFFAVAAIFFIVLPKVTNAANLYFSPSSGAHAVGTTFSVGVYVSSSDKAMNAASGVISFPGDKLEITSLSKTGSIFSLWVQEPTFLISSGTVHFEGIILNPGFTGSGGKIISLTFKTKTAGKASLTFSSSSVLANDGKGTNILASLGSAQFNLGGAAPAVPEATKPLVVSGVPAAPKISSSTHPDSDKWYNNKNPQFSWTLPAGVKGVSLYFSQSPTSNPGSVSDGLLSSKSYKNVADGIWYFHIKFKNSAGWGPITHFKIQIDTQPPAPFTIEFVHGKESIDPSPIITFNTTDALSGILSYQIKIGSGGLYVIDPALILSNPYSLPTQAPGKNTVEVQAADKAGNTITETAEFEILALESPKITRYQPNITEGDLLEIGGTTYPDSDVDLFLFQGDNKVLEQRVRTNSSGDFTFIWSQTLISGTYEVQSQVTDNRGAQSLPSEKITIVVTKPAILSVRAWPMSFLAVAVPLAAFIIILLLFIAWYGWHKFSLLKKKIRKEKRDTVRTLHKALNILITNSQDQLKLLEKAESKRQLTEEEEIIIKHLEKDLDNVAKLSKKIDDIEEEAK